MILRWGFELCKFFLAGGRMSLFPVLIGGGREVLLVAFKRVRGAIF